MSYTPNFFELDFPLHTKIVWSPINVLIIVPGFGGNKEVNQLVYFLVAIGLLIACFVTSCNEIRYAAFGRTQQADVKEMMKIERIQNPSDETSSIEIAHVLTESDGQKREESDKVPLLWLEAHRASILAQDDATVAIQFLPGSSGYSRIIGNTNRWVLIPCAILTAVVAFVAVRFFRDFNAYQRRLASER